MSTGQLRRSARREQIGRQRHDFEDEPVVTLELELDASELPAGRPEQAEDGPVNLVQAPGDGNLLSWLDAGLH